jgi:hypothetical protein
MMAAGPRWLRSITIAMVEVAVTAVAESLLFAELTTRWHGRWATALDGAAAVGMAAAAALVVWRWWRAPARGPIALDGLEALIGLALLAMSVQVAMRRARPLPTMSVDPSLSQLVLDSPPEES